MLDLGFMFQVFIKNLKKVPSSFMFVQFLEDFNKVFPPLHIIKNSYASREGSTVNTHMPSTFNFFDRTHANYIKWPKKQKCKELETRGQNKAGEFIKNNNNNNNNKAGVSHFLKSQTIYNFEIANCK